jgi:hypothetical protein
MLFLARSTANEADGFWRNVQQTSKEVQLGDEIGMMNHRNNCHIDVGRRIGFVVWSHSTDQFYQLTELCIQNKYPQRLL